MTGPSLERIIVATEDAIEELRAAENGRPTGPELAYLRGRVSAFRQVLEIVEVES